MENCVHSEDEQPSVEPEVEEPIDFSQLPLDLQREVVKTFSYSEFYRFKETSRLSNNLCWSETRLFPYDMTTIHVNQKTINMSWDYPYDLDSDCVPRMSYHAASKCPIKIIANIIYFPARTSSGRMQAVAKLFEKNKTTASQIYLNAHITFTPEDLDRLFKVTSPHYFRCNQFIPRQFFQIKEFHKIKNLFLNSTGCTDEELVMLNGEEHVMMTSDFISARGLNNFMRQWKRKQREINYLYIEFGSTNGFPNVEQIVAGLDANPVWTPATHDDSIIAEVPIDNIEHVGAGNTKHVFCIWRPDNYERTLQITINNDSIEMSSFRDETRTVLDWLTEDQYYYLLNKCWNCGEQYCEHRRRYSTAIAKKHFPRTYGIVMSCFSGLRVFTGVNQLLNYISGDRPFTRIPQFGFEMLQQDTGISRVILLSNLYLFGHI